MKNSWRHQVVNNMACIFRDHLNVWAIYDRGGNFIRHSATLPTHDESPVSVAQPRKMAMAA